MSIVNSVVDLLFYLVGSGFSLSLIGLGLVAARYVSILLGITLCMVGIASSPPFMKGLLLKPIPASFFYRRFGLAGIYFCIGLLGLGVDIGRFQAGAKVVVLDAVAILVFDIFLIALSSLYMFNSGFRRTLKRFIRQSLTSTSVQSTNPKS